MLPCLRLGRACGGGTVLQPGVDLLEAAEDFPKDGPILIITDGYVEEKIRIIFLCRIPQWGVHHSK